MTITTISGDTWDMLAYRAYGDETLMNALIQANPAHVRTAVFPAGVTLTAPAASGAVRSTPPPWRSAE